MSLKLILGVSKTGKSTYIYDSIKEDVANNKNVFLFVPSFMKVKAEEEYMEFLNTSGLILVNITTIQDFIENKLEKYNFNLREKYLSDIDKKIILSSIIKNDSKLFHTFSKVVNKKGFIDNLYIYMDLIRKSDINVNEKVPDFKNKLLEEKITELINIYLKYESLLSEKYIDYLDEINIFLDKFFDSIIDKNTKIYFDGYNNFNKSEYKFIEKCLKADLDVSVTLCTDILDVKSIYEGNSLDIFSSVNKTYIKLLDISKKTSSTFNEIILDNNYFKGREDIKFLADNLFNIDSNVYENNTENIYLRLLTNPYEEVKFIAKIINEKIKKGYRYKDFLIYTTNIQEYEDIINREFYEYKIPFYSNVSYSMLESELVQYINMLFLIVETGYKAENILNILKLELNNIPREDIYLLENYIKEFNIYNFKTEFVKNNNNSNEYIYDLERLNSIRQKTLAIFEDIVSIDKNNVNLLECGKIFYKHLKEKSIFENYDMTIKKLKSINEFEGVKKEAIYEQVWENIISIFNSLYKVYKNEILSISFLKDIFYMLSNTIKLKTIPETMDQVELADINEYSARYKKIVFFVGVNENKFPNVASEDILFKDTELELLEQKDMFLKETVLDKENMVKFNIYQALNNILEKLYILIPASDINFNSLRKSSMVTNIENLMGICLIGQVVKNDNLDILELSKDDIFEMLLKIINDNSIDDNNKDLVKKLYKFFKEDEKYKKILEYIKNDDNLNSNTTEMLFGKELETSVSKLELFKKCPFSYFMNYSLGLKERKEFKISSLDIGSFLHEVLEEFSVYLLENNISWQALLIEEEYLKVDSKLDEIINRKFSKILNKNESNVRFYVLKNRLQSSIKKIMLVIAKSFNQSSFIPEGYEITFGKNSIFAPIRIKIDENKYMNIIGKIDRVDKYTTEDKEYIRIVDYKSSNKKLDLDDIKEGLSLQLVTYLDAYIKNKRGKNINVIPAGMLYFNLSDNLINFKEFSSNEEEIKSEIAKKLKLKGIFINDLEILQKMDKNFNQKESLIDISTRTINNNNKALNEQEYNNLLNEVEDILKKIGKSVISGNVKISPNKKADYCKYCKFSEVCRKNISI